VVAFGFMVRYALPSTLVFAFALTACGGATPVDAGGTPPLDVPSTTTGGGEPTSPAIATAEGPTPPPNPDPGPAPSATVQPAVPGNKSPAELVAAADGTRGEKLYEEMKCKGCHGTSAKPSTKFPKLFGLSWEEKRLERAFRVIKKGESPMPGFEGKLDDAQIADIMRFLQDG
jgi:mono/diheme cytochrome c family protein